MNEIARISDPFAVEGHVTIQLRDPRTNKVKKQLEGRNFLSRALTERILRVAQRYAFAHQQPTQWDICSWDRFRSELDAQGFFNWMILTASAMAESPATEKAVPGAVIGYSNRQTHTDTDLRRGIVNRSECQHGPNRTRWVMDWSTDRGNGTIQSVCWGYSNTGLVPLPDRLGVDCTWEWTSGFAEARIVHYEGDYWIHAPGGSLLRRLAAVMGVQVWSLSGFLPVIGTSSDTTTSGQSNVAVMGDHILYVGSDSTLRRRLISTGATSASLGSIGNLSSLAMIGDIVYVFNYSSVDHAHPTGGTLTIRRYNNATATWLTNLSIPNLPANVNTREVIPMGGNVLRVGSGISLTQGWYHDINIDTLAITPLGVPIAGQAYTARDGRMKLWVPTQTTTYTSTTMRPAQGMLYDVDNMAGNFLLSRIRLPEAIVKTTKHTLKVIYDFNYL